MKAIIVCGGLGSRLDKEGTIKPKSLIKIGRKTIIEHLIKIFSLSVNEIILCTGHKYFMFEKYFKKKKNFRLISKKKNLVCYLARYLNKEIKINLFFTGIKSGTGGRLKKTIKKFQIKENFFFTYGDGLSDINLDKLLKFHLKSKKLATVTAVVPPSKYGKLEIKNNLVLSFNNQRDMTSKINGGFFVLSPKINKFIKGDLEYWEDKPMQKLIKINQLNAFEHKGFWKSLDTLKDKKDFDKILKTQKKIPWLTKYEK